jgi:hypothetical protein
MGPFPNPHKHLARLVDVLSEAGKSRQINGIGMFVKVNCKERTQGSDQDFAQEMVFVHH